MVYLTPKFALLAALVSFSAISNDFAANAVAIPRSANGNVVLPRHAQVTGPHRVARHSRPAASDDQDEDAVPAKSSKGGKKSPHRSATPQLVLPVLASKKGKAASAKGSKKGGKKNKHVEENDEDEDGHRNRKQRHRQRMLYDEKTSLVRIGPLDIITGDRVYHKHHGVHDAKPLLSVGKRSEEGVPGTIDIMSASAGGPPHRIAQMYLNRTSTDSGFVLDASDRNSTQFFMVQQPLNTTETHGGDDKLVTLRLPVFNATAAAMTAYCVCFDPRATSPEPMTMAACFESASQSMEHQSQTFSYSPSTGTIRPLWFNGEDDGKADSFSTLSGGTDDVEDGADDLIDPTTPESADIASVTSLNGTSSSDNSTVNGTRWASSVVIPRDASRQAQNVSLVFVPSAPEVQVEASSSTLVSSSSLPSSTASSSAASFTSSSISSSSSIPEASGFKAMNVETSSAAPVFTSIVTATTTTTTSETSTTTMTLVQISGSPSSSATPSNIEAQDFAVSSTDNVASSTIIASSTMTPSSTTESQSTVTAFSTVTAVESSATTAPQSINAEAIAESIAAGESSAPAPSASGDVMAETIESLAWDDDMESSTSSAGPAATQVLAAAASPEMTPVSTAPYEWMFTPDARL